MRVFRFILVHALCMAVLVSGQGMAFARGKAPATDRIEVCSGHATVAMYFDANGQPTTAPYLCIDCLHTFASAAQSAPFELARVLAGDAAHILHHAHQRARADATGYTARAPPV